jgi:hypothetical protein
MSAGFSLITKHAISRAIVTGLFFVAALFFAAPKASAEDCQKRIIKADHNLHEAIEHHGPASKEADHARNDLAAARSWCWDHDHRWWDVDSSRWHTEHDWDDHDHDHLYDHH